MATVIPLSQGYVTLIDDEDANRVRMYNWHKMDNNNRVYAAGYVNRKVRYLHRFLFSSLPRTRVVHIDNNSLNNQKGNLRIGPAIREPGEKKPRPHPVPVYRGVTPDHDGRFDVWLLTDSGLRHVAKCDTVEAAARAYDRAASEKYGKHVPLNFPSCS